MSIVSLGSRAITIALAMTLSIPALAQDETNPRDVPRCSATVTDHCMGSGDHGTRHMRGAHHGHHAMHHRHHHHHHWK